MADDVFAVCKCCQKELPSITWDYCSDACMISYAVSQMEDALEIRPRQKSYVKKCTCGAVKAKTTHSNWCDSL